MAKSDNATVAKRVEEVLRLRLLGANFFEIREYADAPEQAWGVSNTQLRRYIHQSDVLLERMLEKDRQKLINRHLAQRHLLYSRSIAVSDYRTALAVVQDEAKLLKLYPDTSVRVLGHTGGAVEHKVSVDLSALSDDELDLLRRLSGKATRPGGDPPGTGETPAG